MVSISRMWRETAVVLVLAVLAGGVCSDKVQAGRKNRPKPAEPAMAPADGPSAPSLLRYVPDECTTIGTINFAALRENPVLKNLLIKNDNGTNAWEQLREEFGADPERIERLTFGTVSIDPVTEGEMDPDHPYVIVLDLNQPCPAPFVLETLQKCSPEPWKKSTDGPFPLHVRQSPKPLALFLPDDRTIVVGSPELVQSVLTRGATAKVCPRLARACEQLDTSQLFSLAAARPDGIDLPAASKFIPSDLVEGVEAILVHADGRSRLHLRCTVVCRDTSIAYQLKGMFAAYWIFVQTMIDQADWIEPAGAEFLDSIEYAVSDGNFVVQCAIPASVLGQGGVDMSAVESLGKVDAVRLFSCEVPLGRQAVPHMASGQVIGAPARVPPPVAPSSYCPAPACEPPAEGPVAIPADPAPAVSTPPAAPPPPAVSAQQVLNPYATSANSYAPVVPAQRIPPPTHRLSDQGVIAVAPATRPSVAPPSPYPPASATVASTDNATDGTRRELDAARKEIQGLQDRCRRFEQRLQVAEQDRKLLEQRIDLFREQLERCEQEFDQSGSKPQITRPY